MAWAIANAGAQHARTAALGTGPITLAFPGNVTNGNLVIFTYFYGATTAATFSKSSGTATLGTITTVVNPTDSVNTQALAIGWALVTGSGSLTMTASPNGAGAAEALAVVEFSGGTGSTTSDGSSGRTVASLTPSVATFATVSDGDLLFGAAGDDSAGGTVAAGAGFSSIDGSSAANVIVSEWQTQVTHSGVTAVTWTNTVAESTIVAAVAFTLGGGGGGGAFLAAPNKPIVQAVSRATNW